jgi:ABC-type transporter Mla subunit MlaD
MATWTRSSWSIRDSKLREIKDMKRKGIIGGIVAVLVLVAAAWGFGLFGGTDPVIAKLQEIGDQMQDKNLPDADRDRLRGEFRQQMDTMTDAQRHTFFEANRDQWQARSAQQMDQFFAMSKADQQKRLDEILNRMNQPRENQRQGANNGRGNRPNMTEAQREERSKRRLDSTTPKTRAQFSAFRQALEQRAQQRGIKLPPGGGPGFGGGGRGA